MAIGVIIPAFNAAPYLGEVLREIRGLHPDFRILVVDDGSVDGTGDVARSAGAEVCVHEVNRGKGQALLSGFAWAVAEEIEWVFTMDADGQHLPAELASFLTAAEDEGYDVVVGSRMTDTATMPLDRRLTNETTSRIVSWLAGCRIFDSQSGYRLFRGKSLRDLHLVCSHYDLESEILVRLARKGFRIGEVAITTVYGDEHSSIQPLRDTFRFVKLVALLLRDTYN